ncbi:CoA transferase [Nocardia sp. CDC159]|uniref:CoA transferase n=1 Tax=Nocardia pulmonis TaxID=2951408 RepID=A0A9X2E3V1_9NOCA|nr:MULTISPECIES: CoA transferase [Nocardia]MCM6772593.1 CoA transferase [Nocardia pulmonis]MCM6784749.1 CoA transferase [Nocardia sp. CDC159]
MITHPDPTLTDRLRSATTQRATTDDYDLYKELARVLDGLGLEPGDCGGSIEFTGADPVVPGATRVAAATALTLVAKSIAVAKLWRMRGGAGQDISMDLRVAPHRLCPFYEKKWELLNGYPLTDPASATSAFFSDRFYRTADDRFVQPLEPYPGLRRDTCRLLGTGEDPADVARAIARWKGTDLEQAGADYGVVMGMVRGVDEILRTRQYTSVLAGMPLVEIEKIGDSDPEPLPPNAISPLAGIRVLGRGHIIAGAGCGRALSLHGADVLNIWNPYEYEIPKLYMTSNLGVRSAMLDLHTGEDHRRMLELLAGADVFYANRRPGSLERAGIGPEQAAAVRPGIIHATVNLHGRTGPWAGRVGFDQTAGCVAGIMAAEGDGEVPALPGVPVVNDYITAWLLATGVLRALMLRAQVGGSYRVSVSLTRVALWVASLGFLDPAYSAEVAGKAPGHEYLPPEIIQADTPLGLYTGIAEQVRMSQTPGAYPFVYVPRGSGRPEWLDASPRSEGVRS